MKKIKCWIEAMRLRTLPVSVAGVIMAGGCAVATRTFSALPLCLCLIFAILAQIASNFANEYYDFKGGLDRKGREGPRRGVTEGDITPRAMLCATYLTLGIACCVGLSLLAFSGWWLLPVGILVALGVVAYSTGPYPLSHHGLGEVAVIAFFGIVPVCCTYVLQGGEWTWQIFLAGLAMGLMGANVLIVNNYRDADDDRAVGKHTLAVIFGRRKMVWLYRINALAAVLLMTHWLAITPWLPTAAIGIIYIAGALWVSRQLTRRNGRALTPLLGITAMLMLFFALAWFAVSFLTVPQTEPWIVGG
ncbi:MAG: 1,4-dihydroxy-2-naphthoate octaprenyltransferase [Firmicutes bacterium]|nr:1,4-dihydroxy-2-naphthoate octaprenyltransferase [Bacillota bacterium]MCM1400888.1 1,4-dihydroxy-2-naphthoate octaprenyltransferase [Bacteroides sp.]MCM1476278.1 1,4-dihydroxy-2-naphthoate octaprenyltransferase [Bacteroides sp.]